MKVIFMGTPEFAVKTLEALMAAHEVSAVITQPDKPKGRGKKVQFSAVKECALKNNIEVLQPMRIKNKDFVEKLKQYNADVFVVAAYGQMLSEEILYMPKHGSINVHGSILPKYRGAAPIQWAIINGEKETGVTIQQMDKKCDTGDMLLVKSFPIEENDNFSTVHDKMADIGALALIEALDLIEKGKAVPVKQDDSEATHAPMITKETGKINWSNTSISILNLIKGLNPWPSAYTFYDGSTIMKVWNAKLWESEFVNNCHIVGEIIEIAKNNGIVVKTGDGAILITEIQMVGGKRMKVSDYLRGNKLEIGKILKSE